VALNVCSRPYPVKVDFGRIVDVGDRLANFASWHNPDLQRPLELGPIMAALPTFGAECRLPATYPT